MAIPGDLRPKIKIGKEKDIYNQTPIIHHTTVNEKSQRSEGNQNIEESIHE